MRVISGRLKGRKVEGFNLDGTRPTMDRVKESLFATIQDKIDASVCLDLFAGSGNLGIEAISQGAQQVYLVDYNNKAIQVIKNNLRNFNIEEKCIVLNMNFKKALETINNIKFDIIFLDPPYKTNYIEESIELITKYDLLQDDGIIVCESDLLEKIIYNKTYYEKRSKKYGDKYVVILGKI